MRTSGSVLAAGVLLALAGANARAAVNLELRPSNQAAFAGQVEIGVELYAVASPSEPFGVVEAVLEWDETLLELVGVDGTGAFSWSSSLFPAGPVLNDDFTDGDAYYRANATLPCGSTATATPGGQLVTTFVFRAKNGFGAAQVQILPSLAGSITKVYSDLTIFGCGGAEVTGLIGNPAIVDIEPCLGPADCADSNACTDNLCVSGACSNPLNYTAGVDCCDPATGNLVAISDGNECTEDVCNIFTGQVTHQNLTGTACGDPTQTDCTNPDTCLNGVCQVNHAGNGIYCETAFGCQTDGDCLNGACVNTTLLPQGTTCDDNLNCTQNDECNGLGQCTGPNPCTGNTPFCFEDGPPLGYLCGDCIDESNCPPSVGCRTNVCSPIGHVCGILPDDEGCDDGLFCNGVETCNSLTGNCDPGPGNPCAILGQTCDEQNDRCVQCFSTADCDNVDLCNPQQCVGGLCVPAAPVFCAQDLVNEPCSISACDSLTGLCEFVLPETVSCSDEEPCPQGFDCTDPVDGFCFPVTGCSDGTGCTSGDSCVAGECVGTPPTQVGNINFRLVPVTPQPVTVGQAVDVRLELTTAGSDRIVRIVEAALEWDPVVLGPPVTATDPCDFGGTDNGCNLDGTNTPICSGTLLLGGGICSREYDWYSSGLLDNFDPDGLNDSFLDGDAHYEAFIEPGTAELPVVRQSTPLRVTTLRFFAFGATTQQGSQINLNLCTGAFGTRTRVFGAQGSTDDQTGTFTPATVFVQCQTDAHCDDGNSCTTDDCPRVCNVRQFEDCESDQDCGLLCSLTDSPCTLDTECPIGETCTRQDTCGPPAYCTHVPVTNGTACGNQTPTGPCDQPDTCQAGVCDPNAASDGSPCNDGLFCTLDTECLNGVCGGGISNPCSDGVTCTVDVCNESTDTCTHAPSNALCNDGLYCTGIETCNPASGDPVTGCTSGTPPDCSSDGIACTENDFCNEALNRCDGVPNSGLCPGGEVCISGVGCAISCDPPQVYTFGGKYIAIAPQPEGANTPTALLISSPTWTCLNNNPEGGKYVGFPVAQAGKAPGVNLDPTGASSSIDGTRAFLVDDPADRGVLTPDEWGGFACELNGVAWGPACDSTHPCPGGEACLPIRRCYSLNADCGNPTLCKASLTACNVDGDCPSGETCNPGLVVISGQQIAPSNWDRKDDQFLVASAYEVRSDCGVLTAPVSAELNKWGDVDGNGLQANGIDISLAVLAFQQRWHLPTTPNPGPGSILPMADVTSTSACVPEFLVNGADILRLVNVFQGQTYEQATTTCGLPCP